MAQSEEPGKLCYFLDTTPPEVRNRIYAELFPDNATVKPHRGYQFPAVLKTCKQIRNEASCMYYTSTVFCFDSKEVLIKWLCALSPRHIGALTDLRLSDASLSERWHYMSVTQGIVRSLLSGALIHDYWLFYGEVLKDIASLAARGIRLKDGVLGVMVMDDSRTRDLQRVGVVE